MLIQYSVCVLLVLWLPQSSINWVDSFLRLLKGSSCKEYWLAFLRRFGVSRLFPRLHYSARPKRFRSRGPSVPPARLGCLCFDVPLPQEKSVLGKLQSGLWNKYESLKKAFFQKPWWWFWHLKDKKSYRGTDKNVFQSYLTRGLKIYSRQLQADVEYNSAWWSQGPNYKQPRSILLELDEKVVFVCICVRGKFCFLSLNTKKELIDLFWKKKAQLNYDNDLWMSKSTR